VRVIFTPLAERHIDSLHEYITTHASEERADGYVSRIVDFCNGLSTFPLRGTQRDDLLPGLRVTGFERRVTIAFIVTADAVVIEGILMAAGTSRWSFGTGRESTEHALARKGLLPLILTLLIFETHNKHARDHLGSCRIVRERRPGKTGGYAAFASHVSCIAGYQCDSVERHSSFKTRVRTCSKRWAPRSVHRICYFFTMRLLTT